MSFPNINIGMQTANSPQDFTNGLQILIWLTILTLAPSILIMTMNGYRFQMVYQHLHTERMIVQESKTNHTKKCL